MPWLNVPLKNQTLFIAPQWPKSGLLGGAGAPTKMSKLQALAAARKKKVESQKSEDRSSDTQERLDKLSIGDGALESAAGVQQETEGSVKRRKLADESSVFTGTSSTSSTSELDDQVTTRPPEDPTEDASSFAEAAVGEPSAFARTLFGSASEKSGRPRIEFFPLPFLEFAPSCIDDAFAGPSPDDVVLAAQAKGSLLGNTRS